MSEVSAFSVSNMGLSGLILEMQGPEVLKVGSGKRISSCFPQGSL